MLIHVQVSGTATCATAHNAFFAFKAGDEGALVLQGSSEAGSPGALDHDHQGPFAYSGKLHKVTIDVSGDLIQDSEAEMRAIMARQ